MTRIEGVDAIRVAVFGGCVFTVGRYSGAVRGDKLAAMAAMSEKDRDKAAKWCHAKLAEFGHDGRTVAEVRDHLFGGVGG